MSERNVCGPSATVGLAVSTASSATGVPSPVASTDAGAYGRRMAGGVLIKIAEVDIAPVKNKPVIPPHRMDRHTVRQGKGAGNVFFKPHNTIIFCGQIHHAAVNRAEAAPKPQQSDFTFATGRVCCYDIRPSSPTRAGAPVCAPAVLAAAPNTKKPAAHEMGRRDGSRDEVPCYSSSSARSGSSSRSAGSSTLTGLVSPASFAAASSRRIFSLLSASSGLSRRYWRAFSRP